MSIHKIEGATFEVKERQELTSEKILELIKKNNMAHTSHFGIIVDIGKARRIPMDFFVNSKCHVYCSWWVWQYIKLRIWRYKTWQVIKRMLGR